MTRLGPIVKGHGGPIGKLSHPSKLSSPHCFLQTLQQRARSSFFTLHACTLVLLIACVEALIRKSDFHSFCRGPVAADAIATHKHTEYDENAFKNGHFSFTTHDDVLCSKSCSFSNTCWIIFQ